MAINVADNFSYLGGKPLDARVKYDTVANMVAVPAANLYDGCLAYVTGTKKNYQYDSSNDTDPTLGKWRELQTGGGGGSSYTAGDGIDITEDVISTKQSQEGDIDEIIDTLPPLKGNLVSIVNAFNKGDIYSTDEKMIGQWVDGKPLYQKTFIGVTVPTTNLITGIDEVVTWFGIRNYSSSESARIVADGNAQSNQILLRFVGGNVSVDSVSSQYNAGVVNLTIQYTKTTDTAISIGSETEYSTDEKVVGTWIDGKPIYQKTVYNTTLSSIPNNNWVTYCTIENLKDLIFFKFMRANNDGGTLGVFNDICGSTNGSNVTCISRTTALTLDYSKSYAILQYTKTTT